MGHFNFARGPYPASVGYFKEQLVQTGWPNAPTCSQTEEEEGEGEEPPAGFTLQQQKPPFLLSCLGQPNSR